MGTDRELRLADDKKDGAPQARTGPLGEEGGGWMQRSAGQLKSLENAGVEYCLRRPHRTGAWDVDARARMAVADKRLRASESRPRERAGQDSRSDQIVGGPSEDKQDARTHNTRTVPRITAAGVGGGGEGEKRENGNYGRSRVRRNDEEEEEEDGEECVRVRNDAARERGVSSSSRSRKDKRDAGCRLQEWVQTDKRADGVLFERVEKTP
jgi:hypothetical protein